MDGRTKASALNKVKNQTGSLRLQKTVWFAVKGIQEFTK